MVPPVNLPQVLIKNLGQQPYLPVWQAMQNFTRERTRPGTSEIWLVEHQPVFTLGQAGKPELKLFNDNLDILNTQ